jgi:hypothetical protein
MVLELLGYVVLVTLGVWLYLGLLDDAIWLGASNTVLGLLLGALAISVSAPYLAISLGAIPFLVAAMAVLPTLLMALSLRWFILHTGGPRPEFELFEAFKRINRIGQGGATGDRKKAGDNERLAAALDDLERLRTPRTARLIDALDRINRSWVASETISREENEARHRELAYAADELWGLGWRKRV